MSDSARGHDYTVTSQRVLTVCFRSYSTRTCTQRHIIRNHGVPFTARVHTLETDHRVQIAGKSASVSMGGDCPAIDRLQIESATTSGRVGERRTINTKPTAIIVCRLVGRMQRGREGGRQEDQNFVPRGDRITSVVLFMPRLPLADVHQACAIYSAILYV